jgi:phospholipase C
MLGFVRNYYEQMQDVSHSQAIMYYFMSDKLPVLATLAAEFAVCDRWFSSVPGPTIPNRAFAHYGTSFGSVGMNTLPAQRPYKSIYERMADKGHSAKIYYYDQASSMTQIADFSRHPEFFATFDQFLSDAQTSQLPEYSFVEPNFTDHEGSSGPEIASDEHPDHSVQVGELFIAKVYNAIRTNRTLWPESVLLITYSNHGGIYDHVPPPAATPDGFVARPDQTGTGQPFAFDRLGVRVPAVIVSSYIPRRTVDHTVYDHASIPATVSRLFLSGPQTISPREHSAHTFERVLTLAAPRRDEDIPYFKIQ